MALPAFNMRQLLEAGCHFGHQSHRWNPKMAPYIFGARNNIHIIDLAQSVPLLHQALVKVSDVVASGGRVLLFFDQPVEARACLGAKYDVVQGAARLDRLDKVGGGIGQVVDA